MKFPRRPIFFGLMFLALSAMASGQNVVTYHNDVARTGQNLAESVLNTTNVNSTQFGKVFSVTVDGQVYAQPLYLAGVRIAGGLHNVVWIATEHDSVYAFDADAGGSPLWHVSFINSAQGITTMPSADAFNCGQITPELGITGTPVIDPAAGTLYVVATTKEVSGGTTNYVHRLHALDITTGNERPGSPVVVSPAPVAGTGDGSTTVRFISRNYKQRPGLLLLNGVVYTAWSSHCDAGTYHGWVIGYNAQTLQQTAVHVSTPNGSEASYWNAGAGPAADAAGNIYLISGNGTFDADTGGPDYGDAFVKLSTPGLAVAGYFAPYNQAALSSADQDLGSGGALVLPDSAGNATHPHLITGGGKEGTIYLLDRDNLGAFNASNNDQIVQSLVSAVGGLFSMPAYFNGSVYFGGVSDHVKAFHISGAALSTSPTSQTAGSLGYPGATPSISANGSANGIVWAIENSGSARLHAYDATNLAHELYNSGQNSARDTGPGYVKFTVPTIANGKVYVGGSGSVAAYGLLTPVCSYSLTTSAATEPAAGGSDSVTIQTTAGCAWTASSNAAWLGLSTSGSGPTSVTFTIQANTSGVTRTGTLTVAGQTFTVTQPSTPIAFSLSSQNLTFGYGGSFVTPPQTVTLTITGSSSATWTATPTSGITVSPAAGIGNATLTISVGGATVSGSVTVNVTGGTSANPVVAVTSQAVNQPGGPFGFFDSPGDQATGLSGAVAVTGWALDQIAVTSVDIWREPVAQDAPASINGGSGPSHGLVRIGSAILLPGTRPDVQAAYPTTPLNYRAGWGMLFLTNTTLNSNGVAGVGGNGVYRLHVIATSIDGRQKEIGAHTITVDNTHSPLPFGTIDTPAMGETISGTQYVNFAWALTPRPNTIPVDASSMFVSIDGAFSGRPNYNFPRSDIQSLFPGYNNTAGPVGYFYIDTTKLADGLHSIAWSVKDNANNLQGIGSRVFYVHNAVPGPPPASADPETEAGMRIGWDPDAQLAPLQSEIEIPASGRLELRFGRAVTLAGPLPPGARLDAARGVFFWHPPVGTRGEFAVQLDTGTYVVRVSNPEVGR